MALSTIILARQRSPKLSVLAYRISLLLFYSGASYYDVIRLNHLGVPMYPLMIQGIQRKMGSNSDSKVIFWKTSIENNLSALMLMMIPMPDHDSMDCIVDINFSEDVVKQYLTFSVPGYNYKVASSCKMLGLSNMQHV